MRLKYLFLRYTAVIAGILMMGLIKAKCRFGVDNSCEMLPQSILLTKEKNRDLVSCNTEHIPKTNSSLNYINLE